MCVCNTGIYQSPPPPPSSPVVILYRYILYNIAEGVATNCRRNSRWAPHRLYTYMCICIYVQVYSHIGMISITGSSHHRRRSHNRSRTSTVRRRNSGADGRRLRRRRRVPPMCVHYIIIAAAARALHSRRHHRSSFRFPLVVVVVSNRISFLSFSEQTHTHTHYIPTYTSGYPHGFFLI